MNIYSNFIRIDFLHREKRMYRKVINDRMTQLKNEFNFFKKKVKSYKYIGLFGVGRIAESWGYSFVREWGECSIVCFSDNDANLWGKTIIDDLKCVPPSELIKYGKDILCIVLVHESKQDDIIRQLEAQGTDAIGIKKKWLFIDDLVEKYLDIKLPNIWEGEFHMGQYRKEIALTERIAVYTCIVNGYDELMQPLKYDPRCDYYLLGTEKPEKLGIYHWINIDGMYPKELNGDFVRINRYCKMHPHLFFPQHNYSIYIDGRVLIHKELSNLIEKIGKIGIALYGIKASMDIYEHASGMYYSRFRGESREVIREQMQRYVTEGFPRYFGLSENTIMVREHHNENCIQVMNTWWDEVKKYSRRDQLSLMYAIWKNGFTPQDVGYIDDTFRNGPEFSMHEHKKDIRVKRFNR